MSRLPRREFLEQSLLATAAAAMVGTTAELSAEEKEDKSSKSPNERLNVAVIGVNGRGGSHIGGFSGRNDTAVTVICDADENVGKRKAESLSKKTKKEVRFEQDLRKVVEDPSIDIITIATPNHWHSLSSIWAVQNGKDVYVEKPVSHNVSEGRRVVQAAEKYGQIVQTGTQCRSMKGTIDAIEYVKSGAIGEVKLARGLCYKRRGSIGKRGNYDVPASVDYTLWQGPSQDHPLSRPRFHYDWHWQWEYGNGDLGNQGIHQMDIARWGLGVNQLCDSVVSYGGRVGYVDAGETANSQINVYQYGDKRIVFEVRGLPTAKLFGSNIGVIFQGTEGYVVLTSYTGGVALDKDQNVVKKFSGGGDHFGNFVKAVRSRKRSDLTADIEEGHLSSALCHLGNISYRMGQAVSLKELDERLQGDAEKAKTFKRFANHLTDNKVNLEETPLYLGQSLTLDGKKEIFTGELAEKANLKLTREYRKGFEVPEVKNL